MSDESPPLTTPMTFLEACKLAFKAVDMGKTDTAFAIMSDVDRGIDALADERDEALAEVERLTAELSRPRVCAAVMLTDSLGRLLLLKRAEGRSFAGCWCLPGGHMEAGETPEECCARELEEETRIVRPPASFDFHCVTCDDNLVGLVYINALVDRKATAINAELGNHSEIGWFALDSLPGPLMPILTQLLGRVEAERK